MDKKINLIFAAFLLGGAAMFLPLLLKLFLFVCASATLFLKYDDWAYEQKYGKFEGKVKQVEL